jgi:hypothetical protein
VYLAIDPAKRGHALFHGGAASAVARMVSGRTGSHACKPRGVPIRFASTREPAMNAFAIVRFRAKPGLAEDFQRRFCSLRREMPGLLRIVLVKTGECDFCSIGEWSNFDDIVNARLAMRANLDQMRDLLESFNEDLGVTDAVSGLAVFETVAA